MNVISTTHDPLLQNDVSDGFVVSLLNSSKTAYSAQYRHFGTDFYIFSSTIVYFDLFQGI